MSNVLKEAKRLYDLGFGIHWLKPKSKAPVKSGWGTGPRDSWNLLRATYRNGYNVGVRLGVASKIGDRFLCVIDVDIKGKDERFKKEALAAVKKLTGGKTLPVVLSGRGNGSRHLYCLTVNEFKTFNPAQSKDTIKYHSPSKKPSKKELAELTPNEIANGIRLSHAWEVSLYSYGRQVVLPPSIHPDSGKAYTWGRPVTSIKELPVLDFDVPEDDFPTEKKSTVSKSDKPAPEKFKFKEEVVKIKSLKIPDKMKRAIIYGEDVSDRSAYLLPAAKALLNAGLTENQVLNVLTNPKTYLGACGYEHAQTKNRARAAYWVHKYSLKKIVRERQEESDNMFNEPVEDYKPLKEKDRAAHEEAGFVEGTWEDKLRRSQNGGLKPSLNNLLMIVNNTIGDAIIKRDLFSYREIYTTDTPWGCKKNTLLADEDIPLFKAWIEKKWKLEVGTGTVEDLFTHIAVKNAFDPVKDWLNNLPEWDGVPRLDTWLKNNFEAEGDETYLAEVFRKWICAMVVRIYEPGAKFDWMPIFEGLQGVGKSSFGRLLCGDKYFLDNLPNLADKDAALALQGMMIVEMGELSHFRKNELEIIKGFLTRQIDKVRPPYGRRWIESHRRCVFFGTTNQDQYLKDESGNRRFKPVKVGRLNFDALERDRDQLFAEAKSLYDCTFETVETLGMFSEEAAKFERQIHTKKMVSDDSELMVEKIQIFMEQNDENFDFEKFRISELFEGGGCLAKWAMTNKNAQMAAKALRALKAENRKIRGYSYWKLSKGDRIDPHPRGDFDNPPPTMKSKQFLDS